MPQTPCSYGVWLHIIRSIKNVAVKRLLSRSTFAFSNFIVETKKWEGDILFKHNARYPKNDIAALEVLVYRVSGEKC